MRRSWIWAGWLVLTILTAGCAGAGGGAATETSETEAVPVVSFASGTVVAEAIIEPARWNEAYLNVGGEVVEVLVTEGESVTAGAPLVRLALTPRGGSQRTKRSLERTPGRADTERRELVSNPGSPKIFFRACEA